MKMEELEKVSVKSNERVTLLNNELNELNDKLDELKETFESKDSGMNDTSPLVKMKAGLQQIKSEISGFDLRIGVVSHSLLAVRIIVANRKRIANQNKNRSRRNKGRHVSNRKTTPHDDDDSLLSADD